jgi:hypothetical protein
VLSCYDRVIIHGSLPGFGHSDGMTSYLKANGIRSFDYTKFAEPLRDQIRNNAERLAEQNGIEIQFLRRSNIRKESVVQKILAKRGDNAGLVCILAAMEACQSYKPWHDKQTHKTMLRPDSGKCVHYFRPGTDARRWPGRARASPRSGQLRAQVLPGDQEARSQLPL